MGFLLPACSGSGDGIEPTAEPSTTSEITSLPVSGTVTLYAGDPGDRGSSLASGDFNGDGAIDVLFAAAFADGPENQRPDAGEAYLFLGPFQVGAELDAATGNQALTIFGADDGDQTGRAVAAGDFNGDGIDDMILGAPFGDGPAGDRNEAGEVHVVFGARGLGSDVKVVDLRSEAGFTVYGRGVENFAGLALASGAINEDSLADVIIGAFWGNGPDGTRTQAGEVYAFFGSNQRSGVADLAVIQPDVAVYGAAASDRLGESVAAGDVDGDGLDDLVLAAPFAASKAGFAEAGRVYLIHSPPPPRTDLAVDPVDAVIYGVDAGDQLGHAIAARDVDGDGHADVLLGAVSADGPENTLNLAGEAALIDGFALLSGEIDVAAGDARTVIYGANIEDRLGRSAALGDLDGDGRAELLLGAPGGSGPDDTSPVAGEIYVLADPIDRLIQLPARALLAYGSRSGDELSSSVFGHPSLTTADMNGDGANEILVASPGGDGPNGARLDGGDARILFTFSADKSGSH